MAAATDAANAGPPLWVETLWILDALDAAEPIREIPLRPGLNLIVSPPDGENAGHGVGKTAFCQLLRFVLDDPLWSSGSPLWDELRHSFPKGAVAAKVHVGGEPWTVLKPWQHQKQYRASRHGTWRQLANNEVGNEYDSYADALTGTLVAPLPLRELPGSNQPIQWHHLLAWCSRDQNTRYRGYFNWRAEGAGFSLPAKSPRYLVKVALGLMHDASVLKAIDEHQRQVGQLEAQLESLHHQPKTLLAHAKHQLARHLGVSADTPFYNEELFGGDNLPGLAEQRAKGYAEDLADLDHEIQRVKRERDHVVERRAPLKGTIEALTGRIEQLEAAIAGNFARVRELQNKPAALEQRLHERCELGDLLLKHCQHVQAQQAAIQIADLKDIKQKNESNRVLADELTKRKAALANYQGRCRPLDQQALELDAEEERLVERRSTLLADAGRLNDAIADYQHYEKAGKENAPWPPRDEVAARLEEARQHLQRLKLKQIREEEGNKERLEAIRNLMQQIADHLPGFEWGLYTEDEKSKSRPFRLGPASSTTYAVLEILAGDLACLLDSHSAESFHPGFLLHDSPREAEMSESIFWALMTVPFSRTETRFQYIVTTSTRPPQQFLPRVRLELNATDENNYLFRKRIGATELELPV